MKGCKLSVFLSCQLLGRSQAAQLNTRSPSDAVQQRWTRGAGLHIKAERCGSVVLLSQLGVDTEKERPRHAGMLPRSNPDNADSYLLFLMQSWVAAPSRVTAPLGKGLHRNRTTAVSSNLTFEARKQLRLFLSLYKEDATNKRFRLCARYAVKSGYAGGKATSKYTLTNQ